MKNKIFFMLALTMGLCFDMEAMSRHLDQGTQALLDGRNTLPGSPSAQEIKEAIIATFQGELNRVIQYTSTNMAEEILEKIRTEKITDPNTITQMNINAVKEKLKKLYQTEPKIRSFVKAFGWRICGFIITTIISFSIAEIFDTSEGDHKGMAVLIGLGDTLFKLIFQYPYERLWVVFGGNWCMGEDDLSTDNEELNAAPAVANNDGINNNRGEDDVDFL